MHPEILGNEFWFPLQSLQLLSPVQSPCAVSSFPRQVNPQLLGWKLFYEAIVKHFEILLGGGDIFIRYADSVVFDQIRKFYIWTMGIFERVDIMDQICFV